MHAYSNDERAFRFCFSKERRSGRICMYPLRLRCSCNFSTANAGGGECAVPIAFELPVRGGVIVRSV